SQKPLTVDELKNERIIGLTSGSDWEVYKDHQFRSVILPPDVLGLMILRGESELYPTETERMKFVSVIRNIFARLSYPATDIKVGNFYGIAPPTEDGQVSESDFLPN